jgi:hypothetical protein
MAAYEVAAYRGNRNWYRKIADYRQTVRDEDGKPPARERADSLARELLERSHRNRFGWTRTRIDIQPKEVPDERSYPAIGGRP